MGGWVGADPRIYPAYCLGNFRFLVGDWGMALEHRYGMAKNPVSSSLTNGRTCGLAQKPGFCNGGLAHHHDLCGLSDGDQLRAHGDDRQGIGAR